MNCVGSTVYKNEDRKSIIQLSRPTNAGMPNLRKNPFSTDFYRLFQSTDKQMIYGRIYGFFLTRGTEKKPIFGRIYGFFRTEFGYYPPPPPPTLDSRYFARRVNFFRCAK